VEQIALDLGQQRRYLTVSEFAEALRGFLDGEFGMFWLSGEISGCKMSPAGHYYFTLKDDKAQLRCACFRGSARFLKFKPQDGVAVLARGRADLYAERGDLQFIVEAIEPQGHGALQLAFEQLKKRLAAEGLFAQERKRPLPKLPARIGIVTSPTGSVIRDMLNVLARRFPGLHIRLYPALVQGDGSIDAVCRGIEYFGRSGWAEVVIVARGGGSLEDLWTFNQESVARAIVNCSVPVISAIGHETDFTIADFVADLRAPTPSAAAELVICTRQQLFDQIGGCRRKLGQLMNWRIAQSGRRLHQQGIDRIAALLHRGMARRSQKLDELDYRLRRLDVRVRFAKARHRLDSAERALEQSMRIRVTRSQKLDELDDRLRRLDVRVRFAKARHRLDSAERALEQSMRIRVTRSQKLDELDDRLRRLDVRVRFAKARHRLDSAGRALEQSMRIRVTRAEGKLAPLTAHLSQLSPLKILERGYAIVETEAGRVVKSPADAPPGTVVAVRLADGRIKADVR